MEQDLEGAPPEKHDYRQAEGSAGECHVSAASITTDNAEHNIQPASDLGTKRVNTISLQNAAAETTGKSSPLPNKWDVCSPPQRLPRSLI